MILLLESRLRVKVMYKFLLVWYWCNWDIFIFYLLFYVVNGGIVKFDDMVRSIIYCMDY